MTGAVFVVAGLLDTAVLVDVLRKYPPAETWLAMQTQLGVTRVVYLELIEGAENAAEQRRRYSCSMTLRLSN